MTFYTKVKLYLVTSTLFENELPSNDWLIVSMICLRGAVVPRQPLHLYFMTVCGTFSGAPSAGLIDHSSQLVGTTDRLLVEK